MKKRVMILGAGQLQVPILERAKERRYEIVIVSPDVNQPGVPYADYVVNADVKDEETILNAAIKYKINGITTDQTDLPVRTVAYVADKMGLPSIGYVTGCLFTDKYKQRQKSKELGIITPKFSLSRSIDEALCHIEEIGYPAIIKPIDSQASHGVVKILSRRDLIEKYSETAFYSRNGDVLLEQYIEGMEFPVDSYVIDGKCTLMSIGQYHPFKNENVFSSCITIWPAKQPEKIIRLISDTNKHIVEGFGLKNGRTHAEYIISDNRCFLVEIGARGGGSFFSSDDVRYVSGVSTEDFLLDFALGEQLKITESNERHVCCCTLFFYLPENGIVESVDGLNEVSNFSFIRRNNLKQIHVEMKTKPVVDKGARYFIVVVAESYEQLEQRVEHIRSSLRIVTKVGNKKEYPIWR